MARCPGRVRGRQAEMAYNNWVVVAAVLAIVAALAVQPAAGTPVALRAGKEAVIEGAVDRALETEDAAGGAAAVTNEVADESRCALAG